MIVQTFRFMPFASRAGETVVGLRFKHDEVFIAALKSSLARHKADAIDPTRNIHQPGGWQSKSRCWFVEPSIWPAVLADLQARGSIELVEIERPLDIMHVAGPVCVRGGHRADPQHGYVVQEPGGRVIHACDTVCLQEYLAWKIDDAGRIAPQQKGA